jgi:hypothetical protein
MSELIQKNDNRATVRWKLLTGASALALTAYVSSGDLARAEDTSQPQLWIELGGQLSRLESGQEAFSPLLMNARPSIFALSQAYEKPPLYSIDEFAGLSFQPDNSNWVFSASVRYGRSAANRHFIQQTNPAPFISYFYSSGGQKTRDVHHYPKAEKFADTKVHGDDQHVILDFAMGRDVGLGLFNSTEGSSTINLGVRFAQFASKSNIALKSNPDWRFHLKYVPPPYGGKSEFFGSSYHSNAANLTASRSFHGIGPSLSWNASAPFAGSRQDGQLILDWGVNVAVLFGRQRARTHHQTTGREHGGTGAKYPPTGVRPITYQGPATPDHARSRTVTVPNVGGSAGLSFRIQNFKVSAGYRADFFFDAMDGGIDAAEKENVGFHGPFASVSVGLGG